MDSVLSECGFSAPTTSSAAEKVPRKRRKNVSPLKAEEPTLDLQNSSAKPSTFTSNQNNAELTIMELLNMQNKLQNSSKGLLIETAKKKKRNSLKPKIAKETEANSSKNFDALNSLFPNSMNCEFTALLQKHHNQKLFEQASSYMNSPFLNSMLTQQFHQNNYYNNYMQHANGSNSQLQQQEMAQTLSDLNQISVRNTLKMREENQKATTQLSSSQTEYLLTKALANLTQPLMNGSTKATTNG